MRIRVGITCALLAALFASSTTPIFAASSTSGSGDKSAGVTIHTYKLGISQAECDAVHQSYPDAECAITVTTTQTPIKVAVNKPPKGSISPNVLLDQSYCSSHNYFAGTYNLQMVMNGVWSYTMWVQYEGDKQCGAVEYQTIRCYQDWGVLWSVADHNCGATASPQYVWRWWATPEYAYADYTMTYTLPIWGGVFSVGHHGWVQVNGQTGAVSSNWG